MTKTNKDPLIKISKRQNLALRYKLLLTVGAILLSLVLGGILLACLGYNPVKFYTEMLMGNFKNASYLKLMMRALIPLLITSLGVSLAFKMRFWNIGAEGQFIIGAIIAMTFSLLIGDSLLSPLGAIVVVILGTLGGGLYALFVAVLKVKFNTNETLMTLMLNYVALYIASYMLKTDFFAIQGQGVPAFKVIAESLWLTEINIGKFSFDTALFIAVALTIILFVYFRQSKQGYELNVVGDSPNTAKYAGMKVNKIIVRTMFLSGAIIGMAGALKLCGSSAGHTFSANITGGVGWTSIIVAWLAKLNPVGIFIASLLMSILERGCSFARTSLGISDAMSDVLQGIILFTVLASDFFISYRVSFRKKAAAAAQPEGAGSDSKVTEDKTPGEDLTGPSETTDVLIPDVAVTAVSGEPVSAVSEEPAPEVGEEPVSGVSSHEAVEAPLSGEDTPEDSIGGEGQAESAETDKAEETISSTGKDKAEAEKTQPVVQNAAPGTDKPSDEKPAPKKRAAGSGSSKAGTAKKSTAKTTASKKKTAADKPSEKKAKPAATAVKAKKPANKTSARAQTSAGAKKNGKGGNKNE